MNATLILMPEGQPCHLCDHAVEVVGRVAADAALSLTVIHEGTPEADRAAAESGAAAIRPVLLLDGRPQSYGRVSEGRLRRDLAAWPQHVSRIGPSTGQLP